MTSYVIDGRHCSAAAVSISMSLHHRYFSNHFIEPILACQFHSDHYFHSHQPLSDWKMLATINNSLPSSHNHIVEDATELALDRPLWRLLAASSPNNGDYHHSC